MYVQPESEIPKGQHRYQQHGGNEPWKDASRDELLAMLASPTPPAFRSVLGATQFDADGKASHLAGPFYADFDGDLDETCEQFRRFLDKLVEADVHLDQVRLLITGGRGFHVEVPAAIFMAAVPDDDGIPDLHRVFKEMALSLVVDTLDWRVYSRSRQWRIPNVQRDNGHYKVPITADEALSVTPESYVALTAAPRPFPPLSPPTLAAGLASIYQKARDAVFKSNARRSQSRKSYEEFRRQTGGQTPPTVERLFLGAARLRDGAGWNQVALQVALLGHAVGLGEETLVSRCRGLIDRHIGDSERYASPRKRERELRNQYRYVADNPAYEVSIPAVLALLGQTEEADDLRDLAADVPDHGFSVLDLMTGSGKGRKLRTDAEALLELLRRDRRLDGCCYFNEFSQGVCAGRSWREAMGMDHAPADVGELNDDHARALVHWFARIWKLKIQPTAAHQAMLAWARCDSRNPVRERLEEYAHRWDGTARLDSWLIDYANAVTADDGEDFTPLMRAAGCKWLLSAVARVFQPGCQADVALILTGPQGFRKSSILRVLGEALGRDAFADGFDLTGDVRDAAMKLRGRVLVEWAEMSGLTKRDVREVKNFITQRDDGYRLPYERTVRKWPRTAIIAGSANESELFSDATGNRRFWTVEVGSRITREQIACFEAAAGQIWGEACHRYKGGERWWIDPAEDAALHAMAQSRQEAAQVFTRYDDLAVEMARCLIAGEGVIRRFTDSMGPHAWLPVSEMVAALTALNQDRPFSNLEWQGMVTALKRQGWLAKKRTRARTMHYQIGDTLRERLKDWEHAR